MSSSSRRLTCLAYRRCCGGHASNRRRSCARGARVADEAEDVHPLLGEHDGALLRDAIGHRARAWIGSATSLPRTASSRLACRAARTPATGIWPSSTRKSGKALDGSAGTASYEIATAAVRKGQAARGCRRCRHAGAAGSRVAQRHGGQAQLRPRSRSEVKGQKVVLARVKLEGREDARQAAQARPRPRRPRGRVPLGRAQLYSDAEQARAARSRLRVHDPREPTCWPRPAATAAAERRAPRGRARRAGRGAQHRRPTARATAPSPSSRRSCGRSAAQNPGLVRLFVAAAALRRGSRDPRRRDRGGRRPHGRRAADLREPGRAPRA